MHVCACVQAWPRVRACVGWWCVQLQNLYRHVRKLNRNATGQQFPYKKMYYYQLPIYMCYFLSCHNTVYIFPENEWTVMSVLRSWLFSYEYFQWVFFLTAGHFPRWTNARGPRGYDFSPIKTLYVDRILLDSPTTPTKLVQRLAQMTIPILAGTMCSQDRSFTFFS